MRSCPDQSGIELDLPPSFDTVEEEREHRKQRLAGALRVFGRLGFGEGVAGHITVRDPEHLDHFWVNPFGMSSATCGCRTCCSCPTAATSW